MIAGLRSADDAVVREFYRRYSGALQAIAHKHMTSLLRQRVGPEDIVQSVYRTFVRRAGELAFDEPGDLWRLLCAITLTKVREQARFHTRQKRSVAREQHADADAGEGPAAEVAAAIPSPGDHAEFTSVFEHILAGLDDEQRKILELKLDDRSDAEIATTLACSERTVRRLMVRLRERLDALLSTA